MKFLGFRKVLQDTNSSDAPVSLYKNTKAYKKSARQGDASRIVEGLCDWEDELEIRDDYFNEIVDDVARVDSDISWDFVNSVHRIAPELEVEDPNFTEWWYSNFDRMALHNLPNKMKSYSPWCLSYDINLMSAKELEELKRRLKNYEDNVEGY